MVDVQQTQIVNIESINFSDWT